MPCEQPLRGEQAVLMEYLFSQGIRRLAALRAFNRRAMRALTGCPQ